MEVEQFGASHPVVEPKILGQVADPPPRVDVAGWPAEDARLTRARGNQVQQDLDCRGLAGPVRPEEAEDLTGFNGEVEAVQGDLAAVLLAERGRFDGCLFQRTARLSATRFTSFALMLPATPKRWPLACHTAALPTPELSFNSRP
jgi:hypothetical protein